jgi:Ni/Co efflux regulator RcnB
MATGAPVSVREPLVDEDIARMDDEARELRKARLSPVAAANPEFVVPAPALHATREKTPLARKTKPRARARDGPGDDGEDGRGRGADRAESSTHRRKSSLSARGKRASSAYSETGVISERYTARYRLPLTQADVSWLASAPTPACTREQLPQAH